MTTTPEHTEAVAAAEVIHGIPVPTDPQFARFGKYVAAMLGANLEWDSAADYLSDMASAASAILDVSVGDQDDKRLGFWRTLADRVGVDYEAEDEEDDDADA